MLVDIHYPLSVSPPLLDRYLRAGWFRMGQGIFTTNFLCFDKKYYSALWLRIDLKNTQPKRIKNNFHTEIRPFELTDSKEELFEKYKSSLSFETSTSIENLLYGNAKSDIFNTWEIAIYDQDKLIGLGIFDCGSSAAEGIVSFYDPAYKKHSLGKYLIQRKIEYLKNQGFKYFYPGYFAPGYSRFDYKLELDKENLFFLDIISDRWIPITQFDLDKAPYSIINQKLQLMLEKLEKNNILCTLMDYSFYDIGMTKEFTGQKLLEYPNFIFCFFNPLQQFGLVIYDFILGNYQLVLCQKMYELQTTHFEATVFNKYILRPFSVLVEESSVDTFFNKCQPYLIKSEINDF